MRAFHAGPIAGSSWARALAGLALGASSVVAVAGDAHGRAGDVLRFAMPAGVAACEWWRDDHEGLRQFGASWLVTAAATEGLKRVTRVERPDHSDHASFPSGHASHAFAAATYMHRRHGVDEAWPWYVAAGYVGWTRVHAHRHRGLDIAGSAALAAASSWALVSRARESGVSVLPVLAADGVAVRVHASW